MFGRKSGKQEKKTAEVAPQLVDDQVVIPFSRADIYADVRPTSGLNYYFGLTHLVLRTDTVVAGVSGDGQSVIVGGDVNKFGICYDHSGYSSPGSYWVEEDSKGPFVFSIDGPEGESHQMLYARTWTVPLNDTTGSIVTEVNEICATEADLQTAISTTGSSIERGQMEEQLKSLRARKAELVTPIITEAVETETIAAEENRKALIASCAAVTVIDTTPVVGEGELLRRQGIMPPDEDSYM